jgi:hypothetical protein
LLGALLGLIAAPAAWGQEVKPASSGNGGAHRMEIVEGASRTVHYFTKSDSPGERQAYRDLARAENEMAYADNLLALRRQYLFGERALEGSRQYLQPLLYGRTVDQAYNAGLGGTYSYGPGGYWGGGGGGWGGWGGGWGGGAPGGATNSLAIGIGPEGVIKEELAKTFARQATPEYLAAIDRQYNQSVAALKPDKEGKPRFVGPEDVQPPRMVTATLKGGDKIEGKLLREDADWLVIQTKAGEERVRMSEVTRVSTKTDGK